MSVADSGGDGSDLSAVVARLPEVVIVTCVNAGYAQAGLAENWWRSLMRLGLDRQAVVVALDAEARRLLAEKGIPVIRWNSARHGEVAPEALEYRRAGWQEIVFSKVEFVSLLLAAGKSVLFSDADVVFLEDPLPHLSSLDGDLAIQSNVRARGAGDTDFSVQTTCSGFYFARPTVAMRKALDLSGLDLSKYSGEQMLLHDRVMQCEALEVRVLPRERYPNGDYWHNANPLHPAVIHFNWMVGVEKKVAGMKRSGVWFPEDEA